MAICYKIVGKTFDDNYISSNKSLPKSVIVTYKIGEYVKSNFPDSYLLAFSTIKYAKEFRNHYLPFGVTIFKAMGRFPEQLPHFAITNDSWKDLFCEFDNPLQMWWRNNEKINSLFPSIKVFPPGTIAYREIKLLKEVK